MKELNSFRFNVHDKDRWKKCAEMSTRGNLSLWIEMQLNKSAEKVLGKVNKPQFNKKAP
jgi:hypothetical protein